MALLETSSKTRFSSFNEKFLEKGVFPSISTFKPVFRLSPRTPHGPPVTARPFTPPPPFEQSNNYLESCFKFFSALFFPSVCAALVSLLRAFPSEGAGGYGDYGDVACWGARAIYWMVDSHPACKSLFLSAGAEEALRAIRARAATSAHAKSEAVDALMQLVLRV